MLRLITGLTLLLSVGCGQDIEQVFDLDWIEDPITLGGVSTRRSFRFTDLGVTVTRTCGSAQASVDSVATHGAIATLSTSVTEVGESDFGTCTLAYEPATYDLTLLGGELIVGGQVFRPDGETSGIYGEWVTQTETSEGTPTDLMWLVERDNIQVSAICARTGVAADLPVSIVNILEVPETVSDASEADCILRLDPGTYQYIYEGDTIRWGVGTTGSEVTLRRN